MNAPLQTAQPPKQVAVSRPTANRVLQRKCTCGGTPGPTGECAECRRKRTLGLQTKLTVNTPGDRYEQEADRVAEQVMRMSAQVTGQAPSLQIQRLATAPGPVTAPPSVEAALATPGQSLDTGTRQFMETRFGHDFGQVRIHADAQAAAYAADVQARAYTVGSQVVFGRGAYAPGTEAGRRLLAHELTHVVQQGGNTYPTMIQRAEVDDRSCTGLTDIESDIDTKVNGEISNARTAAGSSMNLASFLIDVNQRIGDGPVTPIEKFIESLSATKRNLPSNSLSGTKYSGAGAVNRFYHLQTLGVAHVVGSAAKVHGICIGADKLGHFFGEGFTYFRIVSSLGLGLPQSDAESAGHALEIGIQGLSATGVFSNADRAANLSGLQFYKDLAADPLGFTFKVRNYISNQWNEQTNPSFYESSVGHVVWGNLLTGDWSGQFTSGGSSTPPFIDAKVNLHATTAGSVTGTIKWPAHTASPNVEKIKNGKITQRTTSVTGNFPGESPVSDTPVNGVRINYEWELKTASGKGKWDSVNEQEIQGTWGIGSSNNNGGIWKLKKI